MKIAIVGYDVEGRATYEYFAKQGGHELTILDQKTDLNVPADADSVLGDAYLNNLERFDLIVRTAGMHPSKITSANPGIADRVTTHINEFMKACPTRNIIGITGTKGKGTTSTLIAKMLEADGKTVRLGGNIGLPPLNFIGELDESSWVVLELSSFQLIDLQYSPHIAVCLMVVPEHLDWHPDINEYTTAKTQLFKHQLADDAAIYLHGNELSELITSAGYGQKIPYFAPPGAYVDVDAITIDQRPICYTSDLKLLGRHNWQNVCAALTAFWQVSQNAEAAREVLTSFTGLPHRLEMVREFEGVRYYDDSFGTTPQTAQVAIQAFDQPLVAILGGSDKGIPFDELTETINKAGNVKNVIAIGQTGPTIATLLEQVDYKNIVVGGKSMPEIVEQARQLTQPGDVVLLSTGCASFDMFKNYKDRGEQFTAAVQALA